MPGSVMDAESGIRPRWYVMVTSATGNNVFATMGPYPTAAVAEDAAVVARVLHYRIAGGELQPPSIHVND